MTAITTDEPARLGALVGKTGVGALVVGHCAGMIDLIALPVWIGALITHYGLSPQQAGGLATLFLLGVVLASVATSRVFQRIMRRPAAAAGFAVAAFCFLTAARTGDYRMLMVLHGVGGMATGVALSLVHGSMGRTANPHRMFAIAGMALGLFGLVFMGVVPNLILAKGGPIVFLCFGVVMIVAAIVSALAFPDTGRDEPAVIAKRKALPLAVFAVIAGVSLMTFNQAMIFSFVEVIGKVRGFAPEVVIGVLIALGLVNFLFPAPLAAFLQNRIAARTVVRVGPVVQAALALSITFATALAVWAPSAAFFVAVLIFTHTFAFGLLARMDPSGRAVAATPAMVMTGSAFGPIIGGILIQNWSPQALGYVAIGIAALAFIAFAHGSKGTT